MTHSYDLRTADMPTEMRALLTEYPRDSWPEHPGFKDKTRQWLSAHQMFRDLGETLRLNAETYLDRGVDADGFGRILSRYGNVLVRNLHGHHHWEDHSYFPELSEADPRFDRGLEILEKDHEALDVVLGEFTQTANRTLKLLQLDETSARDEAGELHGISQRIEAFLDRHLGDEEELAVPIILHHRLRG